MTKIIYKYIKNCLFMLVCIMLLVCNEEKDVYGCVEDGVITTDIWATTYDENYHWEYCTLCGEIRNKVAHVYTKEYWAAGYESCYRTNYCTRICDCGYSYKYTKPHPGLTDPTAWTGRYIHYQSCIECLQTFNSESCYNSKGKLSCLNPGICSACGVNNTKDHHFIGPDGCCNFCDEQFVSISAIDLKYAADRSYVTAKFTLYPMKPSVTFSGWMHMWTSTSNFGSNDDIEWSSVKNSDGSCTYTGKFTFDKNAQRACTVYLGYNTGIVYVNGKSNYLDYDIGHFDICQDNDTPVLVSVDQVDQKTSNDWATIKELTVRGTDKYTNIVTISIKDKETGEYAVKDAKADVTNGQFAYRCTPPLEGPVAGRQYIVEIVDQVGNRLEKEFTIYKTDSRAPRLTSTDTFTQWSKTKEIELQLTDYGAGSAQTSLNDQVSYKDTRKDGNNYYANYVFAEENYGITSYNLYMRDGLGNATRTTIKVGKIDNTRPTITNATDEKTDSSTIITLTANDLNKRLNAQGSGVARYAITNTVQQPKEDDWQTSNKLVATKPGRYYLWARDLVGNISDALVVTVYPDRSIVITNRIIYDKGKKEKESLSKDSADKDGSKTFDNQEIEKYDETPKTGDYSKKHKYMLMMAVTGIGIIVLKVFRKRMIA